MADQKGFSYKKKNRVNFSKFYVLNIWWASYQLIREEQLFSMNIWVFHLNPKFGIFLEKYNFCQCRLSQCTFCKNAKRNNLNLMCSCMYLNVINWDEHFCEGVFVIKSFIFIHWNVYSGTWSMLLKMSFAQSPVF